MRAPVLTGTTLALVLLASACGSSGDKEPSGSGAKASVKAGDSTCTLSTTTFTAGKVELAVENTGKDVTEVYVYGKGGSGAFDKVVGEVEDIAPGTSRDLDVTLDGGDYEVACKPGQKGDGIRTGIEVNGEATGDSAAAYDREVEVKATEYRFEGLDAAAVKTGEKIEVKLENEGKVAHNLVFRDAAGKVVGEVATVEPGKDGEAVITFATAGTYTYACTIGNHAEQGMKGTLTVS